jgi:zinc transporter ZupT
MHDIALVPLLFAAALGLGTTSSCMLGAAIGLYCPLSKRVLACVLAFAAGALISALAIELAFQSVQELHHRGFGLSAGWAFAGGGFALGAVIYYWISRYLEAKGAAIRSPARFREYAREQKRHDARELIGLLSRCDLLRHLPADEIEELLPYVRSRRLAADETLFRAGDPGDALYIVARGEMEILGDASAASQQTHRIARLGQGDAFGEMALLSGGQRTATARSVGETDLLAIEKRDFDELIANDPRLAEAVERLSHQRAITNLGAGGPQAATWAKVAAAIGAKFTSFEEVSLTLALGMFIGGVPEAAASAAMLKRAGYRPKAIFGLWSTVLVAGVFAALVGKAFLASSGALPALFCQAIAGGAVLALIAHAMIPEAIEDGGSLVVLPTVAGFLFAFYLSLVETMAP